MMKVLAVKQPWASLIAEGKKTIEVRSQATHKRERIAIYASLSDDQTGFASDKVDPEWLRCIGLHGYIVGTVEIVGCTQYKSAKEFLRDSGYHLIHTPSLCFNPEIFANHYGWILENPVKLETPIPYKMPRGCVVWANTDIEV